MADARRSIMSGTEVDKLVKVIDKLAESNKLLSETTEKEIDAVKSEYKDLRAIVETQSKSTNDSITKLTDSMHDMSKSLNSFALKSQHSHTQSQSDIKYQNEKINSLSTEIDHLNGQFLIKHQEDNERDVQLAEVGRDIKNISNAITKLDVKIDTKGKWLSDNWNKIFNTVVAIAIGGGFIYMAVQSTLKVKGG